ncbi:flagellar hook-basal body complex protein FliE [bacterium]|nr:flagellar hook-basal body complex protein FliE [bacterium]
MGEIGRIRPLVTHNLLKAYQKAQTEGAEKSGFGDLLKQAVNKADATQKNADMMVDRAIIGQEKDLHKVMMAQEEASLTFELLMEVRNKLMDAYTQIMQMQV